MWPSSFARNATPSGAARRSVTEGRPARGRSASPRAPVISFAGLLQLPRSPAPATPGRRRSTPRTRGGSPAARKLVPSVADCTATRRARARLAALRACAGAACVAVAAGAVRRRRRRRPSQARARAALAPRGLAPQPPVEDTGRFRDHTPPPDRWLRKQPFLLSEGVALSPNGGRLPIGDGHDGFLGFDPSRSAGCAAQTPPPRSSSRETDPSPSRSQHTDPAEQRSAPAPCVLTRADLTPVQLDSLSGDARASLGELWDHGQPALWWAEVVQLVTRLPVLHTAPRLRACALSDDICILGAVPDARVTRCLALGEVTEIIESADGSGWVALLCPSSYDLLIRPVHEDGALAAAAAARFCGCFCALAGPQCRRQRVPSVLHIDTLRLNPPPGYYPPPAQPIRMLGQDWPQPRHEQTHAERPIAGRSQSSSPDERTHSRAAEPLGTDAKGGPQAALAALFGAFVQESCESLTSHSHPKSASIPPPISARLGSTVREPLRTPSVPTHCTPPFRYRPEPLPDPTISPVTSPLQDAADVHVEHHHNDGAEAVLTAVGAVAAVIVGGALPMSPETPPVGVEPLVPVDSHSPTDGPPPLVTPKPPASGAGAALPFVQWEDVASDLHEALSALYAQGQPELVWVGRAYAQGGVSGDSMVLVSPEAVYIGGIDSGCVSRCVSAESISDIVTYGGRDEFLLSLSVAAEPGLVLRLAATRGGNAALVRCLEAVSGRMAVVASQPPPRVVEPPYWTAPPAISIQIRSRSPLAQPPAPESIPSAASPAPPSPPQLPRQPAAAGLPFVTAEEVPEEARLLLAPLYSSGRPLIHWVGVVRREGVGNGEHLLVVSADSLYLGQVAPPGKVVRCIPFADVTCVVLYSDGRLGVQCSDGADELLHPQGADLSSVLPAVARRQQEDICVQEAPASAAHRLRLQPPPGWTPKAINAILIAPCGADGAAAPSDCGSPDLLTPPRGGHDANEAPGSPATPQPTTTASGLAAASPQRCGSGQDAGGSSGPILQPSATASLVGCSDADSTVAASFSVTREHCIDTERDLTTGLPYLKAEQLGGALRQALAALYCDGTPLLLWAGLIRKRSHQGRRASRSMVVSAEAIYVGRESHVIRYVPLTAVSEVLASDDGWVGLRIPCQYDLLAQMLPTDQSRRQMATFVAVITRAVECAWQQREQPSPLVVRSVTTIDPASLQLVMPGAEWVQPQPLPIATIPKAEGSTPT